jgi:hypothetical protein
MIEDNMIKDNMPTETEIDTGIDADFKRLLDANYQQVLPRRFTRGIQIAEKGGSDNYWDHKLQWWRYVPNFRDPIDWILQHKETV